MIDCPVHVFCLPTQVADRGAETEVGVQVDNLGPWMTLAKNTKKGRVEAKLLEQSGHDDVF